MSNDNQWVCANCGRRGGFLLEGRGFVRCHNCKSLALVENDGRLTFLIIRNDHMPFWEQKELTDLDAIRGK